MSKKTNPNRMTMNTAVGLDSNGLPVFEPRAFDLNSDDDVAGGGMPMAPDFLVERILTYNAERLTALDAARASKNTGDVERLGNENVAITLGKESLMLLLAQKDCAGVRFYFCKNPSGRDSVAAVGVRVIKTDDNREEAQDIGVAELSEKLSILSGHNDHFLNLEVGPPNTIKDFFKAPRENPVFMNEIKSILLR